jgi:TolB protein
MLAIAACGSDPETPVPPSWDIETAPLVYTGRRGQTNGVFLQNGPSGPPLRFLDAAAARNQARFSPDGTRIAYQVREGGAIDIHVADADGSNDRNLTNDPAFDVLPRWSPDGTHIAFMSTRGFELGGDLGPFPGHVYVVGADGTGLRQVTTEPLTSSLGPEDWSPDGRTLLVGRTASGIDLFALDVETGSETRLTSDPADEYGASYSPDGTRIAFHVETADESRLAVMLASGAEREIVSSGAGRRYSPAWSPDGEWLLFSARGDGEPEQYDLRAIRLRDRHEIPVVVTPESESEGTWLPRSGAARATPAAAKPAPVAMRPRP